MLVFGRLARIIKVSFFPNRGYITPSMGSDSIVMCNAASVRVQCLDVSEEAFCKSLLFPETSANSKSRNSSIPSNFIEADLKHQMDEYNRNHQCAGGTTKEKEEIDDDSWLSKELLSKLKRINLALKVSRDEAPSGMFNKGIFLTLTSSRGGFGPAIQASGNVKIRFVDVDTLPGLLGVGSAGLVPAKYAQRDFNVLINVVKESTQYLNSLNKLAVHASNMSKALLTNKSAKEMAGWPDDSESTLVRGKSAIEMAGGMKTDNYWIPSNLSEGATVSTKNVVMYYQKGDTLYRDSVSETGKNLP